MQGRNSPGTLQLRANRDVVKFQDTPFQAGQSDWEVQRRRLPTWDGPVVQRPERSRNCYIVPRVYFEADWPGMANESADVLAIDRDGMGDAHIVEIRKNAADALAKVPSLLLARALFR